MVKRKGMNKKTKLLAVAVVIMTVLSLAALIQSVNTTQNPKAQHFPIRVACVGDSISNISNYPDDLWLLLGTNYTVAKFGVNGATASLYSDVAYINQPECQAAKDFEPDIVIIMLGTNDATTDFPIYRTNYTDHYKQIVTGFQTLPNKPQIWLMKPPPIVGDGNCLSTASMVTYVIPAIEKVANETNLPTIDVYSALVGHPEYFADDGVHPNSVGSQMIAEVVYKALTGKT